MKKANCFVNKNYTISEINDNVYGSFIEHMGRAVYSGIYEPSHELADGQGFREDVLEAINELNVPVVRYPGGNFVSGYDWKDGIGKKKDRPVRLDYAWFSVEDNQFGIDEFADWSKKASTNGMIAVNLGTGTPAEAGQLIEYCNIPKGTYWSDLRIKNGHEEPHNFKVWCLGNEMDGPWQTGQMTAKDYAKKAKETAKILKWVDPTVEVVACGSSAREMPTFPEWDMTVLDICYEYVDYISLHRYYQYEGDIANFLGSFKDLDEFINTIKATAQYVKAKHRSKKDVYLSLDEWNVWYAKDMDVKRWEKAPSIAEDVYTLLDALVVGGLLCTIVNNADTVKMACLAQLVNALAPIHTAPNGGVLRHTTYYPFMQVSNYGRGKVYKNFVVCDEVETPKHGKVPMLQTLTTFDEEKGQVAFFVLNTSQEDEVGIDLELSEFGMLKMVKHEVMHGEDLFAVNSFEEPNKIVPKEAELDESIGNKFEVKVPRVSWNMFIFKVQE